jgi:hypothetical protein
MEGRNRGEYVLFAATLSLELMRVPPVVPRFLNRSVAEKPALMSQSCRIRPTRAGAPNKLQKCHGGKLSEIALLPNADVVRYL